MIYRGNFITTGLSESVVAAALARIGYKVLHLDVNDYYSGYWASFSFESLQEWITRNSMEETVHDEDVEVEPGEVFCPTRGTAISNIEVLSYLRDVDSDNVNLHNLTTVNESNFVSNTSCGNVKGGTNGLTAQKFACDFEPTSDALKDDVHTEADEVSYAEQGHYHEITQSHTNSESGYHDVNNTESRKSEDEQKEDMERHKKQVEDVHFEDMKDVKQHDRGSEVTGSYVIPECEIKQATDIEDAENKSRQKEASDDVSSVHSVLNSAGKTRMKHKAKLNKNATRKDFSENSRKFNLDLSPKVLFSRGVLVESLISANISHYAEFKVVSRILTFINGRIEEVPCSRSDVFSSNLINVLEKRALMRFMAFCSTFEQCLEEYESFKDEPFIEFLQSRKLTKNLQHIILNSIACVPATTSTLSGLKATQKFLQSLGRYGNTPFLWSLYGAGEIPQAFCRMCAVFGGIYCLRKKVRSLVLDEENSCVAVISDDGQRLQTKWVIMEKSYVPDVFQIISHCMTSRAIVITDSSLKQAEREHISILTIPGRTGRYPVRVIELGSSSMACPESLYVVHFTTETVVNASEDLSSYVEDLFTTPDAVDSGNEKPVLLWAVYFNMESDVSTNLKKLPTNVRITSRPSAHLDFEDALVEAKEIFTSICPNEKFLPAVPNPEDIIWDDIGSDVKEEHGDKTSVSTTERDCSVGVSAEGSDHANAQNQVDDAANSHANTDQNTKDISTYGESIRVEECDQNFSNKQIE